MRRPAYTFIVKEEITLQKFYDAFAGFAEKTTTKLEKLDILEHRSEIHEARLNALTAVVIELKETVMKIDKRLTKLEGAVAGILTTMVTKEELKATEDRIGEKIEEEIQSLARTTYSSILNDRHIGLVSELD